MLRRKYEKIMKIVFHIRRLVQRRQIAGFGQVFNVAFLQGLLFLSSLSFFSSSLYFFPGFKNLKFLLC